MMGAPLPPKTRFSLTPAELESALWQRLCAHFTERLELKRRANDHVMGRNRRNRLIGEIGELRHLLELTKPRTVIDAADDRGTPYD